MKRQRPVAPKGRRSARIQAAMEFLMTYGWAILIISVALIALYELHIFSPSPNSQCLLAAGFSCLNLVMSTNGLLTISAQQTLQSPINITAYGCNSNTTLSPVFMTNLQPSQQISVPIGGNFTVSMHCFKNGQPYSGSLGSDYVGYVILNYTPQYVGLPHTMYGSIVGKASLSGTPYTSSPTTATTSTTSSTTSSTSTSTSSTTTISCASGTNSMTIDSYLSLNVIDSATVTYTMYGGGGGGAGMESTVGISASGTNGIESTGSFMITAGQRLVVYAGGGGGGGGGGNPAGNGGGGGGGGSGYYGGGGGSGCNCGNGGGSGGGGGSSAILVNGALIASANGGVGGTNSGSGGGGGTGSSGGSGGNTNNVGSAGNNGGSGAGGIGGLGNPSTNTGGGGANGSSGGSGGSGSFGGGGGGGYGGNGGSGGGNNGAPTSGSSGNGGTGTGGAGASSQNGGSGGSGGSVTLSWPGSACPI